MCFSQTGLGVPKDQGTRTSQGLEKALDAKSSPSSFCSQKPGAQSWEASFPQPNGSRTESTMRHEVILAPPPGSSPREKFLERACAIPLLPLEVAVGQASSRLAAWSHPSPWAGRAPDSQASLDTAALLLGPPAWSQAPRDYPACKRPHGCCEFGNS